jgi:signal transduction histidine kinase
MKPGVFITTRIGRRFLAIFLGISLLPLAVLGFLGMKRSESALREQTTAILRAASNGAEAQLREFLRQLKGQTLELARDPRVREALHATVSPRAGDSRPVPSLDDLLALKQEVASDVLEISAVSPSGRVLGSSIRESVGADLSSAEYFHRGRRSFSFGDILKDSATGVLSWVMSAPILDEKSRQLLGVLILRVNPRSLSDLTTGRRVLAEGADTQSFRIGETGETYIVNRQLFMITESRYLSNSVFRVRVDTLPVRIAFDQGHEIVSDYKDYRGIPVSGASIILRDLDWVVVTEIDFNQAFAPIRELRWELMLTLLGLSFVAAFLAWTSTSRIIWPIRMITQSDEALARADESAAIVPEDSLPNDEIGELVRRRNTRVQALIANQRQLEERTLKLREMVSELEHISYAIVHDMRAPLRAMHAFAEILRNEDAADSPAERATYLQHISTAAARLDHLTQDVLSYNRAVLHSPALARIDLQALLRGILDTYPNLQPDRADITIEGILPAVVGNEALLTQCFANLLDNATKFVAPGARPLVRIYCEASSRPTNPKISTKEEHPPSPSPNNSLSSTNLVRIFVEDKGIGIPLSAQSRIFRMFQRATHDQAGTGLGLAIVNKVVERMGGHVGVQSEPGKGSRFWVELHAAP